jgi:AAA family ATP:ADP antiporter
MQRLLERALGLGGGEIRRAWPLVAYLFLTTTGTVAVKAARDALFLDRFSPTALPYVDIAIATLVAVCAGFYIRLGRRTDLRSLQVGSLLVFAATALVFWVWAETGTRAGVLFVSVYVWVGVLSVLAPSQVWTLANYVLTTREAKRAFGLIGSGAILGWIVGGIATRALVARFGTENMLAFVAALQLACAPLVVTIWRRRPEQVDADEPASGDDVAGGLRASLAMIARSRYLKAIAALVLLSALSTTVAGWQFKAIAKMAVPDTDELAVFFGTFNMYAGLASLVVQLVATSRILKHLGVGPALFVVPVALAGGSVGVLVTGTLLAAALLKASDQVLRYSIDKSTTELLYLPVPAAQTFRAKAFIDTVVYRLGDAGGGLLVLLFAAGLGWSAVTMSWVCLAAIAGWLVAAVVGRAQYVDNLRQSIHQHRVDAERAAAPVLPRETTTIITSRLTGEPDDISYALSVLEASDDHVVHPAVHGLLRHERPDIRRRAVGLLARAGDGSAKAEVERLLTDPALEVRTEALLYVSTYDAGDPLLRIQRLGDFEDFSVRSAIVVFLARPGRAQNLDAARVMLAAMVDDRSPTGARTRLEAARLLARLPDVFDRELRRLIDDEDQEVAKTAIAAVGRLKKRAFVGRILERMSDLPLVEPVVDALTEFGDRIVGTLRDCLLDRGMPIDVRRQIPAALQAIGTRAAQAVLADCLFERDVVVRYNVIAALNKLAQLHPEPLANRDAIDVLLDAEILGHYRSYQVLGSLAASLDEASDPVVQGLRQSMIREGERIFRLLKILHPDRDMHSAYVGLRSLDPVVHDNAVEFLDSILTPEMRARMLPLFDRDVAPSRRVELANRLLGATVADREAAVAVMAQSEDPWLRSCAAYAIGEMRLTRFTPTLDGWVADADPLLRATALDARGKLRPSGAP